MPNKEIPPGMAERLAFDAADTNGDGFVSEGEQEAAAAEDAAMQRQLNFERQRSIQEFEVEREIEVRQLFERWQRERAARQG